MEAVPADLSLELFDDDMLGEFHGITNLTALDAMDDELTAFYQKHSCSTDEEGSSSNAPEAKRMRLSTPNDVMKSHHRTGGLGCSKNPGRNAEIARLNRERKKAYVSHLEATIKSLEKTVAELKENNEQLCARLTASISQVDYLAMCLKHESTLGQFLTGLGALSSSCSALPASDTLPTSCAPSQTSSVIPVASKLPQKSSSRSRSNFVKGTAENASAVEGKVVPLTINVHLHS